jgi:hypothetical protein
MHITALSPLGESDFWTPLGSIGPHKPGRVARRRCFRQPGPRTVRRRAGRAGLGNQPSPKGRGWPAIPMHFIGRRAG